MDLYLYQDPNKDTIWTMLVREYDIGLTPFPEPPLTLCLAVAERLVVNVRNFLLDEAYKHLINSEPLRYIEDNNLKIGSVRKKLHRVTSSQSDLNQKIGHQLDSQEALFGVSWTFKDRSHSAMFKLRYGGGANGVKEFRLI